MGVCLYSIYLLNASSREERQQWMAAVKKCQAALSPKPSPKAQHRIITKETSAEAKVTDVPSKSPDQAAFDSDSSGDGSTGS